MRSVYNTFLIYTPFKGVLAMACVGGGVDFTLSGLQRALQPAAGPSSISTVRLKVLSTYL